MSGAVAQGAFEAGVFRVLAERDVKVVRIVAASSGALTGTVYAAGVRSREEKRTAEELVTIWRDQAGWRDIFHFSVRDIIQRKGLLNHRNILELLRRHARPSRLPDPAPIELHLVVAPLQGMQGSVGGELATTYTEALSFGGEHFDREDLLEEVFTAAMASSSFPLLFAPTEVPGLGPCIDGGLVNSTPIRFACSGPLGTSVDALLVTAPTPSHRTEPRAALRGRKLAAHVVDMLFSERLYHDLGETRERTAALARIDKLALRWQWSPEEVSAVREALGFNDMRAIPIVSIRPLTPLPGDLFTGFFSETARNRYIEVGMERASQVLDQLGWR